VRKQSSSSHKQLAKVHNSNYDKMPKSRKRNGKKSGLRAVRSSGSIVAGGGPSADLTQVTELFMPLFPAKVRKTLRYSTNVTLASTAGAVTTWVFAANGLFDPDVTGTGHQPMGFDQMMVQYNHFCVAAAKIKVVFKSVAATAKMTVCIRQDAAPTPITVIDRIVEMGGCVLDYLDFSATSGAQKTMWLSVDMAKSQGISPAALTADNTLRGDVANNPVELTYFHVSVWDAAASSGTVNCDVILEQDSYFLEPRDQTVSLEAFRQARLYMASTMGFGFEEEKQFVSVASARTVPLVRPR